MKLRLASRSLLLLCLAAVPALADTIYDNGPINGSSDGWTVNFGFIVSNTFTVGSGGATVNGLEFGAWIFPGDVLLSIEVSITDSEFGGHTFLDDVVNISQTNCVVNQYGFNLCTDVASFPETHLDAGTYWLNLQNGIVNDDPIYWDENSGPSQASQNSVGTIPSEAFTLLGTNGTSTTGTTGTIPEPTTVMLLGSGILGMAGLLRRRWF